MPHTNEAAGELVMESPFRAEMTRFSVEPTIAPDTDRAHTSPLRPAADRPAGGRAS